MRGPRVPFLERLVPGAGGVRAALPSRFAAAPAAWVDAPLPAADAAEAAEVAPAHEAGVPNNVAPATLRGESALALAAQAPASPTATTALREPAAAEGKSGELLRDRTARPVATAAAPVTAVLDVQLATAPVPTSVPSNSRVVFVAAPGPPAAITPATPLRESSLPVRPEQLADAPLVVHVSIDRIEVRAPAPQPRSEPAPAKRGPATQPLADYLRQRAGHKESA